jgi:hypothetical protein
VFPQELPEERVPRLIVHYVENLKWASYNISSLVTSHNHLGIVHHIHHVSYVWNIPIASLLITFDAWRGVGFVGRLAVGVGLPAAWAGVGLMGRLANGVLLCMGGSPGEPLPSWYRFSNTAELNLSKDLESLRSRFSTQKNGNKKHQLLG